MGWATAYIARLKAGETVSFRPRGSSMTGKIESGQLCTVAPIEDLAALEVGDIVLCRVNGNEYLHLVKAIQGQRFQIGNNRGFINGWIVGRPRISLDTILGQSSGRRSVRWQRRILV